VLLDHVEGDAGDDARETVSAAGKDQRLGARVEERVAQLLETPRVVTGEEAEMALEDAFAVARLEPDVLQGPGAPSKRSLSKGLAGAITATPSPGRRAGARGIARW